MTARGAAYYLRFGEVNCYEDHGGVDLDGLWDAASAEDCAEICDTTPECRCFVLGQGDLQGKCWLRSSCSLDQCDRGDDRFATFLSGPSDVADYTVHVETNCWNGHGGEDLPTHWYGTTAAKCAAACNAESDCTCFVMGFGEFEGQCWLRKSCALDHCDHGDPRFATYTTVPPLDPTVLGYTLYANTICSQAHGATDLPGFWYGKSAVECAAVCDADPLCDCFVHDASGMGANCWKRRGCEITSCEPSTGRAGFNPWDTYTKTKQITTTTTTTTSWVHWELHEDVNCYDGHGGIDLPGMWEGQDSRSCAAICIEDPECFCFVLGVGEQEGKCWKRASCRTEECESGGSMFDTYVWDYDFWEYYYYYTFGQEQREQRPAHFANATTGRDRRRGVNHSASQQAANETGASSLRGARAGSRRRGTR